MMKLKNALEVGKPRSGKNERLNRDSWYIRSAFQEMNPWISFEEGGVACEVEPDLCLFFGINFHGAIEVDLR